LEPPHHHAAAAAAAADAALVAAGASHLTAAGAAAAASGSSGASATGSGKTVSFQLGSSLGRGRSVVALAAEAAGAAAAAAARAQPAIAPEEARAAAKRAAILTFVRACEAGDGATVALALHETPSLAGKCDDFGRTPAHFAARAAAGGVLELLRRCGGPIERPDAKGRTPLVYAARQGRPANVRALLAMGVPPSAPPDEHKLTPLHHAVLSKSLETAEALLEGGADCAARDAMGNSPLALAAQIASPAVGKLGLNTEATEEDWRMHELLSKFARGERKPTQMYQKKK
jgi:hypothetical protein